MNKELYQIGQFAKKANVNIQTLRYYERIKLLVPMKRKGGDGMRYYGEECYKALCFIRNAQSLGFQLDEIKEMMSFRTEKAGNCQKVKDRAEAKIISIREKILFLKGMEKNLKKLALACDPSKNLKCAIISGLEN